MALKQNTRGGKKVAVTFAMGGLAAGLQSDFPCHF